MEEEVMSDMPWDNAHLRNNLQVLARLQGGNELSVLKDGAIPRDEPFRNLGKVNRGLRHDFKIRTGGLFGLKKKSARNKKGEDLLEDMQYKIPLSQLFGHARAALDGHNLGITATHLRKAHQGLRNLCKTYASWDVDYRNKVQEILQVTAVHLPGFAVIDIKGRGTTELLRRYAFMGLERELIAEIDFTGNAACGTEAKMSQMAVRNVYGRDRGLSTTAIPTQNQPGTTNPANYRRQRSGICVGAFLDWKREGFVLNGVKKILPATASMDTLSNASRHALLEIYTALGHDEAMLYVTSQLVQQGGLSFLISNLLTFRRPAGGLQQAFRSFSVNGFGITPNAVGQSYSVDVDGGVVRCSVDYSVHTKLYGRDALTPTITVIKVDDPMVMGMVHPQFVGIKRLTFTLAVELERNAQAIDMRLVEFKMAHNIVRRTLSGQHIQEASTNISDAAWVRRWCR
jgi:hypothetical protein